VDARRRREVQAEEERVSFDAELAQSPDPLPSWVTAVYLSETRDISLGAESSRLRITVADHAVDHLRMITGLLRAHSSVRLVGVTEGRSLKINPRLTATAILGVLRDIDPAVSEHLRVEQERREHEERTTADLLGRLQASLIVNK